jgi:hypothetical protein
MVFFIFSTGHGGEGVLESCVCHLLLIWVSVVSLSWQTSSPASSSDHGGG